MKFLESDEQLLCLKLLIFYSEQLRNLENLQAIFIYNLDQSFHACIKLIMETRSTNDPRDFTFFFMEQPERI